MSRTSTRTRLVAASAAVVLLGGGATAVAATQHGAKATPHARYEAALAQELGVAPAKLTAAERAASSSTVDALRSSGKLDAAKAKRLDAAIAKGRTPFAAAARRRGGGGIALLARALGTQPKELRTQLRGGATPADLIAKAGKDPAQVEASIQAAVRAKLQPRVDAGRIDAAKADARAKAVATRLTADAPLRRGAGAKKG